MVNIISGPNTEFALRISSARHTANLTQEELADLVKVDKRSISQYENGHMFPRGDTIKRLAEHLGVDAVWLATGNVEETLQYLANQRQKKPLYGSPVEVNFLFIEEWESLQADALPLHLPRYNPAPRYGAESSAIENFVPVTKTFFDTYRATRYPGTLPSYEGYPADSILIFDAAPITVNQIDSGDVIIFRFRGNENQPGLRRLFREPGISNAWLVSVDPSMQLNPIPMDQLDIEIVGVVIWQWIARRKTPIQQEH